MKPSLLNGISRRPLFTPDIFPFANCHRSLTPFPSFTNISPTAIKNAYDFPDNINLNGLKIACIEAFYNDSIINDLAYFSSYFSLNQANVKEVYPFGKSSRTQRRWILESNLDVQWLSALAPGADIYCVFSPTESFSDVFRCIKYAVEDLKCDVVSMCFGTREFFTQGEISEYFKNAQNTVFVCASGDSGGDVYFPSTSSQVLSVGGSCGEITEGGFSGRECAWSYGGGGPSAYEKIPVYQQLFDNINILSDGFRACPDVALCACNTQGVPVFITLPEQNISSGWTSSGGTSFSACVMSAAVLYILKSTPSSLDRRVLNAYFYALAGGTKYDTAQTYFRDIVCGANRRYTATIGWDFCTGLGSPSVKKLMLG